MKHISQNHKLGNAIIVTLMVSALCCPLCATETNALLATSQFTIGIEKEKYKDADAPSLTPVFRWDFSKAGVVHAYAYEQEIRMEMDDWGQDEISGEGVLLMRSQGDNTAELVLKDLKVRVKDGLGSEDEPETMEQRMPPVVIQGIKENGSGSFGDSAQNMLLHMLFPLPSKPLSVGESVNVPAQMPFNVGRTALHVTGQSCVTLTRYVKISDRTCAQFDVDTDISDLKVPTELKGEYQCSTKGKSVFYFDVAERSFVSGELVVIMQCSIDASEGSMSTVSDNLIKITLME